MQGPRGDRRRTYSSIPEPRHYPRRVPRVDIRGDEVDEDHRFVASFLNGRSVRYVLTFPRDILRSNGKLWALFEVWKNENQVYFPAGREEARRFEEFKKRVKFVHGQNSRPNSWTASLNESAVFMPSTDPCVGCHLTEEQAERNRRRYGPRRYELF